MPSPKPQSSSLLVQLWKHLRDDDEIRALTRKLVRVVRDMLVVKEPVQQLTYNDAIAYFVNERPDDPRIVKGALLLLPERVGTRVFFLFLDEQNTPLCTTNGHFYGRNLKVQSLDEELEEAFGGTELLLLE